MNIFTEILDTLGFIRIKSCLSYLLPWFLSLGILTSCGDQACKTNTSVEMNVNFRTGSPSPEHDTLMKNLTVYGVGKIDQLLADSVTISSLPVSLNPASDTSGFIFEKDGSTHLLSFIYERESYLVSFECGFITRYHLKQVNYDWPGVDSVVIINQLVTNNNESLNVTIYF